MSSNDTNNAGGGGADPPKNDEDEQPTVNVSVRQNIITFEPFSGTEADKCTVKEFIAKLNRAATVNDWEPDYLCLLLPNYLTGPASKIWESTDANIQKNWTEICRVMKERFQPKKLKSRSAQEFHTLSQKEKQTSRQYATQLEIAATKAYPQLTADQRDPIIKHRFLQGLRPALRRIVQIGMGDDVEEGTLASIVAAAELQESFGEDQPADKTTTALAAALIQATDKAYNRSSQPTPRYDNPNNQAGGRDACFYCKKIGHRIRDCRKRLFEEQQSQQQYRDNRWQQQQPRQYANGRYVNTNNEPRTYTLMADEAAEEKQHQLQQNNSSAAKQPSTPPLYPKLDTYDADPCTNSVLPEYAIHQPTLIYGYLEGEKKQFMVDTGSGVSIVPESVVETIPAVRQSLKENVIRAATSVTGQKLQFIGQVRANITMGQRTEKVQLYVSKNLPCEVLLGTNVLHKFGPVILDVENGTMVIGDEQLKLTSHMDSPTLMSAVTVAETTELSARTETILQEQVNANPNTSAQVNVILVDTSEAAQPTAEQQAEAAQATAEPEAVKVSSDHRQRMQTYESSNLWANTKCLYCSKKGHRIRECRQKRFDDYKGQQQSISSNQSLICWYCKKPGHRERECRKKRRDYERRCRYDSSSQPTAYTLRTEETPDAADSEEYEEEGTQFAAIEIDANTNSIAERQDEDEGIRQMKLFLKTGELPEGSKIAKKIVLSAENYVLQGDVLIHLWHDNSEKRRKKIWQQVVIPESMRAEVIKQGHDASIAAHLGFEKTYEKIRQRFFWEAMFTDIKRWVDACQDCRQKKTQPGRRKAEMVSIPVKGPFNRVAVDEVFCQKESVIEYANPSEVEDTQQQHEPFQPGMLVFAKQRGAPLWPARIATEEETPDLGSRPKHKQVQRVIFMGDNRYTWIEEESIRRMEEVDREETSKKKHKGLLKAMAALSQYVSANAELKEKYSQWINTPKANTISTTSVRQANSPSCFAVGRAITTILLMCCVGTHGNKTDATWKNPKAATEITGPGIKINLRHAVMFYEQGTLQNHMDHVKMNYVLNLPQDHTIHSVLKYPRYEYPQMPDLPMNTVEEEIFQLLRIVNDSVAHTYSKAQRELTLLWNDVYMLIGTRETDMLDEAPTTISQSEAITTGTTVTLATTSPTTEEYENTSTTVAVARRKRELITKIYCFFEKFLGLCNDGDGADAESVRKAMKALDDRTTGLATEVTHINGNMVAMAKMTMKSFKNVDARMDALSGAFTTLQLVQDTLKVALKSTRTETNAAISSMIKSERLQSQLTFEVIHWLTAISTWKDQVHEAHIVLKAITEIGRGILSPDTLPPRILMQTLERLQAGIWKNGKNTKLAYGYTRLQPYYTHQLIDTVTFSTDRITVTLKIPLTHEESMFTIWSINPKQMPLEKGKPTVVHLNPKYQYVGVNAASTQYVLLTSQQYKLCSGDTIIHCPVLWPVMSTKTESCEITLFNNEDEEKVQKYCPVDIHQNTDPVQAFELGSTNSWFMASTPTDTSWFLTCEDKVPQPTEACQLCVVTIPCTCSLTVGTQTIPARQTSGCKTTAIEVHYSYNPFAFIAYPNMPKFSANTWFDRPVPGPLKPIPQLEQLSKHLSSHLMAHTTLTLNFTKFVNDVVKNNKSFQAIDQKSHQLVTKQIAEIENNAGVNQWILYAVAAVDVLLVFLMFILYAIVFIKAGGGSQVVIAGGSTPQRTPVTAVVMPQVEYKLGTFRKRKQITVPEEVELLPVTNTIITQRIPRTRMHPLDRLKALQDSP